MRSLICSAIFLMIFALSGCVGTDVGNPQDDTDEKADVELHFAGYEQTNSNALMLENSTRIESAWIVLDEFRFQQSANCSEDAVFDVIDPVIVDLLAEEPTYEPPTFTKQVGEYCQLDIGFTRVGADRLPQQAPQRLEGHSVVVEGERSDGVAFSIQDKFDDDFNLVGAMQQFRLDAGHQSLIIGFALNTWINEGELDAIEGEEPIVIDSTHHVELLDEFHDNVKRSADLFADENDNAELDADEQVESMAQNRDRPENNRPDEERADAGGEDGGVEPDVGR